MEFSKHGRQVSIPLASALETEPLPSARPLVPVFPDALSIVSDFDL
jgi:hypothetical protein